MGFATLAVIGLVGILGPLLALPRRWHIPVVIGELLAGVALGRTGAGYLHPNDRTFTLLAEVGLALVMFVAGTHVPVRHAAMRSALRAGVLRALVVGAAAAGLGVALSAAFATGHAAVYAVLMASSSAALILPVVDSLGLAGDPVLQLLPQIALADAACIVALPLAIEPGHALRAAAGAAVVIAVAVVVYGILRQLELRGTRRRVHKVSEDRKLALELRIQLVILFALAALAVQVHVSVMLAGFAFGLGVSAMGEPRRLARQLFAVTEGLFGPLFFVWLGSSLDLRELGSHLDLVVLGLLLGLGAVAAHLAPRLLGQPAPIGLLASAQLGVPVAAVAIGTKVHVLQPAEAAALILGALVTIAAATAGGALSARAGLVSAHEPSKHAPLPEG